MKPRGHFCGCSIAKLCLILHDLMDYKMPGFPVSQHLQCLPKFMSVESVMLSNHLILCHPLLLPSTFSSIRVFSIESALHIRWPKYWRFSFSISPSNEYSGLISFKIDWFDLFAVLESSLAPQFAKSSALSLLHSPTLTSIHDYWKNHSFNYTDLWHQSDVSAF